MFAISFGVEPWCPKIGTVRVCGGQIGEGHLSPKLKPLVDEMWKSTITDKLGFLPYDAMRTHA